MDTEMKSRIHHRPAKPKAWDTESTEGTAVLTTNYTNGAKMKNRIDHRGIHRRQGYGGQAEGMGVQHPTSNIQHSTFDIQRRGRG